MIFDYYERERHMEQNLYQQLCGLTVYRSVLNCKPVENLKNLLEELKKHNISGNSGWIIDLYSEVFYALAQEGYDSITDCIHEHICYDESPFANAAARKNISHVMEQAARHDLAILNSIAALSCGELKEAICAGMPETDCATVNALPEWECGGSFSYEEMVKFYEANGSGWFARYKAFVWQDGGLHPVPAPDFLHSEEMWGYQRQRNQVIENTRALMAGNTVNNILLYGASGTGKSATVKSMLGMSEFEGLRLIEVQKEDLTEIPQLVRKLDGRPQKFIIFIDDLSFDKADKTFSSLKTILEGGLEPRPANVAVYCTSNRRHLVQQNFSDRNGDEIDANETIQDKTSLAERFGIRILFSELNKMQFIQMAEELAAAKGVNLDHEFVKAEAVKWDIRHPSRSPRSANQFVADLLARF